MTMSYEIVPVCARVLLFTPYSYIEPVYLRLTATLNFRIYHRFYDRQGANC